MQKYNEFMQTVGAGRMAFWVVARDAFSSCGELRSTIAEDYGNYFVDYFYCMRGERGDD
jgi:hypothetical protein